MIPENYIQRVMQFARQGYTAIDFHDPSFDTLKGLVHHHRHVDAVNATLIGSTVGRAGSSIRAKKADSRISAPIE